MSGKKTYLGLTVLLIAFLYSCKREPLEPYNFFQEQEIQEPITATPAQTDTVSSPVYFDAANAELTDDGYHYRGTLYFKNIDSIEQYGTADLQGAYPAAKGDFMIQTSADGVIEAISGQGSPVFSDMFRIFLDAQELQVLYTDVGYDLGENIKKNPLYKSFPLQDKIYYLYFGLNNFDGQAGLGLLQLKNSGFTYKTLFIDPLDPMFLLWGDLKFKTSSREFELSDMLFGLSASGRLPFTPLDYPSLEQVLGDLGFYPFTGHLYLEGTFPLDQFIKDVPLEAKGQMVIRMTDPEEQGFLTYGPDASFILGINGQVYLTHDLLSYIPQDLRVEVGRATIEYSTSDKAGVIIAGQLENQMASDAALPQMLGPYVLSFLSIQSTEAHLYARYISSDDYMFYFDINTGLNIPGLGQFSGLDAVLGFSPDSVFYKTKINLGFGLSNMEISGNIDLNTGDFEFRGVQDVQLDILGMHFYGQQMGVLISSELEGVKVWGSVDLGYDIASVYVEGLFTADELRLEGTVSSNISFGDLQIFAADLHAIISSKSGVELSAQLDLPYGIGHVDVSGGIKPDELYLSGHLSLGRNIEFAGIQLPAADLTVSASTLNGVFINSKVTLPYGIGEVQVTGELTAQKLKLTGQFSSKLEFAGFTLSDINMMASLSTDPAEGVSIYGNVNLLGGLGQAVVEGRINSNELYLHGYLASDLDLGFTSFHSDLSVTLSSRTGISFSGDVFLPFGIGKVDMLGHLGTDGSFSFTGSATLEIHFTDSYYAEASLSITITNNSVDIDATGTLHLGDLGDLSVDISISINWADMTMTFSVDTPLGELSVTVDFDGKDINTGKQVVYRLD